METQVLAQRGINPVSGEKEAMTSGGEIDIQTLVHSVMSKVQTVTPIGKAFARLKVRQFCVHSNKINKFLAVVSCLFYHIVAVVLQQQ